MKLLEHRKTKNELGIIHFIGIGGIGISGIAEIMHNLGYKVQGSDLVSNNNTNRLSGFGIKIFEGHSEQNLDEVEYIVISSAVKEGNVEYDYAIQKSIPVIKRSEMLAEIMKLKTSIAVSGSHGKTTTTSLIASMFESSGLNPTVIAGGIINNKSTNAYLGKGDYLVVEADESDATFIHIPSTIAVITNIDKEHVDFYGGFEELVSAFEKFINNLPFYGFAVACVDDKVARNMISKIKNRKVITYGIDSDDANVKAFDIELMGTYSTFSVKVSLANFSIVLEKVNLPIPGIHNILNSLAAIAIAIELDFGIKNVKNGFRNFVGVKRRFTNVGRFLNTLVFDDYAHHPNEIISTLKIAKNYVREKNGKLVAIFQPHRYSRLKYLFDDFVNCFNLADKLYVTSVYPAGEATIEGCNSEALVNKINLLHKSNAETIGSLDELNDKIRDSIADNDIILFMGAGNITQWAKDMCERS